MSPLYINKYGQMLIRANTPVHFCLFLPRYQRRPQDNSPSDWVDDNGARIENVPVEKHLPLVAVQVSHFDRVGARVRPVHVTADPVNGDTLRRIQSCKAKGGTHGSASSKIIVSYCYLHQRLFA